MRNGGYFITNWAVAIYVTLLIPMVSLADPMPALSLEERSKWASVGRVNMAGYRTRQGCTGTLIAPHLVLTAAHCVSPENEGATRHFIAGWDRGTFVTHRRSDEVLVHPQYEARNGSARFLYDMALIWLNEPIDANVVPSIPVGRLKTAAPDAAFLFGYHNRRPHVLNAHKDCPLRNAARVWVYECEVISGNSGGPAVSIGENGPEVVGVIAGRIGDRGRALVVPVNDWLIYQWQLATKSIRAPG